MTAAIPHPVTRMSLQQEIERLITEFHPDAIEATEILDAITASVSARYDNVDLSDVHYYGKRFRQTLDELDDKVPGFQPPPVINKDDQYA